MIPIGVIPFAWSNLISSISKLYRCNISKKGVTSNQIQFKIQSIHFGPSKELLIDMLLSPEHIKKFKEIYKTTFGIELNDQVAYEKGIKLIRLFMIIDKPISEDDYRAAKTMIALLNTE